MIGGGGDDRDVMTAGESENVKAACRNETSRRLLIILRLDNTESDGDASVLFAETRSVYVRDNKRTGGASERVKRVSLTTWKFNRTNCVVEIVFLRSELKHCESWTCVRSIKY